MKTFPDIGLVLTGGGARGAYQSGALRAVTEITNRMGISQPFTIFSGTSAGAINVAYLAANAERMALAAERLAALWGELSTDQVLKTGPLSFGKIAFRWALELLSGSTFRAKKARALLDTAPLRQLLEQHVSFDQIQVNIEKQFIKSVVITAINYSDGISHNFFQLEGGFEPWYRARRVGTRAEITADHIMASAAIPLLFPPIKVGDSFFGDGSLRNYTPMSPAIKLGAEKLLVITVRKEGVLPEEETPSSPSLGRIVSVLLNSVLLDAIDMDQERLTRINHTLSLVPPDADTSLKPIDVCMIQPSEDIGLIASEEASHMPLLLKYLVGGLGSQEETQGIISYLLFEAPYTRRLIELGYSDAVAKKDEIIEFYRKV